MFENVLFLEKRGCNFFAPNDSIGSDVGNYRVDTHGEVIPGRDGNTYFLEFCLWRNAWKMRYTNKRTGQPLKHPKQEIINPVGILIDTQFTNEGGCRRNCQLESDLHSKNYSYTKADILTITNSISTKHFDRIIFADEKAIEAVPHILKSAGWRERDILEHLQEVTRVHASHDYLVYRYHSDGASFDYEVHSRRITG